MAKEKFANLTYASFTMPIPMKEFLRTYLAQHNMNTNQLITALMVALATGDITINKLEYGSLRKQIDMFTTVDIINVAELYDRNGNRLNPTKLDGVRDDLNVINE